MIADVVDAIISERPYRAIRDIDAAMDIIKSDDEKYCQEFVSALERVLKS
jgi:HD-GYP domain-containing protein (c-di-GMP phosphodiesterase class II)